MKFALFSFLFAAAVFQAAECITCFSCYSLENAGCQPFNSSLVEAVNCDKYYPEASQCIAYTTTIGDTNYTTRTCASRPDNSNDTLSCDYISQEAAKNNNTVDSCYTCTSHLCNSALTFRGNTLGVLMATVVFTVIMGMVL